MRDFISPVLPGMSREQGRSQFIEVVLRGLKHTPFHMRYEDPQRPPGETKPPQLQPFNLVPVFEEDSTRTKSSGIRAAMRKGGVVPFTIAATGSSLAKGETLEDTAIMLNQYGADIVYPRTKTEGVGVWLCKEIRRLEQNPRTWTHPGMSVIIGGEGTLHHNTQIALDATTIELDGLGIDRINQREQLEEILGERGADSKLREHIAETMDTLKIAFIGDMKYSRVVHSWVQLGQIFGITFLLVAPPEFEPPEWWYRGVDVSVTNKLSDVCQKNSEGKPIWPYGYFTRAQLERLVGTPGAPGAMTDREARRLVSEFHCTDRFMLDFGGKIMHAQPRDSADPMVPDHLKDHDRSLILMASKVGVPVREGIIEICREGKDERGPILEVPKMVLAPEHILKKEWWHDHYRELQERYAGEEGILQAIKNGTAQDRLETFLVPVHDQINAEDGIYQQPGGQQIIPGRKLWSKKRQVWKGTLWLFGYEVPIHLAAKHGIFSADVRFSFMSLSQEEADSNHKGYMRIELPLPEYLDGCFDCLNGNCITNRPGAAKPIFRVFGKKGEKTKDGWAKVTLQCAYCFNPASAREHIEAKYGYLIRYGEITAVA